jgi:hypothetical protein
MRTFLLPAPGSIYFLFLKTDMIKNNDLFPCPHCGAEIKINSAACPYCGSDKETGWSSDNYLNGLDLPEKADEPSYEELSQNEFGNGAPHYSPMKRLWLTLTALFLLIAFTAGMLLALRSC